MRKILILCILFTQCFCLSVPESSSYDKRITYAVFNPNDVFQITAANGYVSVIEFAKNERIVNISTGFSDGWEITDRENLLFIKPKAYKTSGASSEVIVDPDPTSWKTNLIVTTNLNFYTFELVLNPKKKVYKMSFTYPELDKESISQAEAKLKKEIDDKKISESLNRNSIPRNWDFYMKINKDSEDIAPNFAYDDGVFTYLGFDNTKTFPSVFSYENGQESILNTHIKYENNYTVLVIHKIAKQILLRSGDKLVGIFNRGYGKNPLNRTVQTSNDDEVIRELKNGK